MKEGSIKNGAAQETPQVHQGREENAHSPSAHEVAGPFLSQDLSILKHFLIQGSEESPGEPSSSLELLIQIPIPKKLQALGSLIGGPHFEH